MTIALVGNEEVGGKDFILNQLKTCEKIIAVDGGLQTLIALDIKPMAVIGDFDSVLPEELNYFPDLMRCPFPIYKDKSDMKLGIE